MLKGKSPAEDRRGGLKKAASRSLFNRPKKKRDKLASSGDAKPSRSESEGSEASPRLERRGTVVNVLQGVDESKFHGSSFLDVTYNHSDVFYRTAFNSMRLEDIFRYLDELARDDAEQKQKLVYEGHKASAESVLKETEVLVKRVKKFLTILIQFRSLHKNEGLPAIFHQYMAEGKAAQVDLLNPKAVHSYIELLSLFVHQSALTKGPTRGPSSPMARLQEHAQSGKDMHLVEAKALLLFLESHRLDPYSAVIGMRPSKDVMATAVHTSEPLPVGSKDTCAISHAEVMQNVLKWSLTKDPSEMLKEIRQCAAIIRGVTSLKRGELAVVELESNNFVYARYTGVFNTHHGFLEVCISSKGYGVTVPLHRVYPLPSSVRKLIEGTAPASLEKLVQSPVDNLYSEMNKFSHRMAYQYMRDQAVDMTVLERSKRGQCSILDLAEIKKAERVLQGAIPPPRELTELVNTSLSEMSAKFMEKLDRADLFSLTCEKTIKQLETFDHSAFVTMELQRLRGDVQSAVDQLSLQKRDLVNGTRKNQLVEWWLVQIRQAVVAKLSSIGYHLDAVPDNYTVAPPKDISQVMHNVKLLGDLLNVSRDAHKVQETIRETQELIYPKIDAFIVDAKISLLEYFGKPCDEENVKLFKLEWAKEEAAKLQGAENADEKTVNWVTGLIMDLEYLQTMIFLESDECTEEERKKHFHIVPVSGLFISVLCRMENECKTALELWAPVAYVTKTTDENERAPLYRAISSNDLRQVKLLLAQGAGNDVDEHGWTPLHFAASRENTLKCCIALLMSQKEIDVNCQNEEGNTAMHYVVRNRIDNENSLELQLHIVQLMLKLGVDLKIKNNLGETALHTACFQGNVSVARVLLQAFADPNSLTTKGATCLHYAAQANSPELVTLLIDFAANPYIACEGQMPVDMALKLNFPEVAAALHQAVKARDLKKKKRRKSKR